VYVLSGTVLLGQQRTLTTPLTTAGLTTTAPASTRKTSAPATATSEAAPARVARHEGPSGAVGPSATTSLEAEYFSGVASSSYPISVPRGRGGVIPALSLDYRSSGGNTWVGVGWDLHPGALERQTKNGLDYDADKYAYRTTHGSETLVRIGPATDNLYGTEIASRFEKFEKKTAADGQTYWLVTDTRGTQREYGATAASRIADPAAPSHIFAWRLNRVTDTLGNTTVLTYTADGANRYLESIRYAESGSLPATNVITFVTEARPDVERSFELGFEMRTARRLTAIQIQTNGNPMPSLALEYGDTSDATGRSLLRSVVIVSADGTTKLPPTTYRYQGARLAVTAPTRPGPTPTLTVDKQCLTGDFNGDTYTDMACYTGKNGVWQMTLSSATTWTTNSIQGPAPGADATRQCTTGDLNADGRTDILCYTTVGGQWHRMLGSASGWDNSAIVNASKIELPIYRSCVTGDMNADGRTDLACWKGDNKWEWTLSRGDAWDPPVAVANGPRVTDVGERCNAGDFNADGRTDLTCFTSNGNLWYMGYSNGTGWLPPVFVPGPRIDVPLGTRCLFGDFNADRRTDIVCYTSGKSGERDWELYLNSPTGLDTRIRFEGPRAFPPIANRCVALDFNGDGRTDLSCYAQQDRGFQTYTSRGETLYSEGYLAAPDVNTTVPQRCALGDFNGDGKGDIACRAGDNWQLMLSGEVTPDLMSGTTNTFGGITSVEYSRAATMTGTRIPFPLDVVTKSTSEDGTGRKAVTNVTYIGGYYDIPTRDFRGFRTARIAGPVTNGAGAIAVIRYHQGSSPEYAVEDPSAEGGFMRGRPDRIRIRDQSDVLLRETNFLYGESPGGPSRFNPLVETTSMACEHNVCGEETRTVNSYDRFGNVVRIEDYGDLTRLDDDVTRITTYAYNEQKYIVTLPSTEEIRAGIPAGARLSFAQNFFDGTDTCTTAATATVPTHGLITRTARWVAEGQPMVAERAAFDEVGNVVCRADPLGNRTTFTFDSSKIFLLSTQNALAHRTTFTYYGVGGHPLDRGLYGLARTVTDPNGAVTTTEWDNFGRRTRAIAPLGSLTTWTYTSLGTPLAQNIRTLNSGLQTTAYLDGFGRTVKTRRSGPEQKFILTTARFDERGLPVATSLPYFEGQTPAPEATVVYDSLRRPFEERDAAGSRRTICYSSGATDLIDQNGHRTRRVVSARGRLLQVERYSGVYERDCAALPLHGSGVVQPYSITQYREDAAGRLTQIIDAKGVITTLLYDGLGRRTRLTDPAVGERHFNFNAAGDETSWTSPSGAAVFVRYDVLHRPVQKDYLTQKPLGSGDVIHVYDEAGRNGIGRLTSSRNASGSRSLTYDIEGHVTIAERILGGKTYRERRRYDTLGRTIEIIYPDGKQVTQAYDGPTVRSVYSGSTTYALFSSYNAAGFAEKVQHGNGTVSTSTYETPSNAECPRATYRLCSTKTLAADGTTVLFQASYGYDAKGNVTVAREPSIVRSYIYDEFDRLRGAATSTSSAATEQYRNTIAGAQFPRDWASLSAPSPQIQLVEGYAYDPADDITWKWDVGTYEYPQPTAAVMNPHAPRKAGANALLWDRDGNLLSGFGRTSAYNADGRVVAIDLPAGKQRAVRPGPARPRSYQYQYDTDGARVRESGPRGITTYAGELTECTDGGRCVNHIFAGAGRVATESPDGNIAYYHRDHQRSVRAITDRTGRPIATYAYSSYGAPGANVAVPSFLSTSVLFGSQPYAEDAGVYSFGGRAYDPLFGRFLSPDTIVPAAGSPQYLNRYTYGHANPVSIVDPDGHLPAFIAGIIFGAIVGALTAHFQHSDWRRGALFGAITAGFTGLPISLGLTGAELAAASIVSGMASGGINAAIGGGDIGRGILSGGLFASASLIGYRADNPFGFWARRPDSVFQTTVNQLARSAFHGAVYGGMHAIASGENILSGILHGAKGQALGSLGNMAVGHALGIAGSLASGNGFLPDPVAGQFVYKTPIYANISKGYITFGNVTLAQDNDWPQAHEFKHTDMQDPVLGPAYIPAHGLSLVLGTVEGRFFTFGRPNNPITPDHHEFGGLEHFFMGSEGYGNH